MSPQDLIADIYAHYSGTGNWPLVRDLQRRYGGAINVRLVCAEIGRRFVRCDDGHDSVCRLTVDALVDIPKAAADLLMLARTFRMIGQSYAAAGPIPITHLAIREQLQLDESAVRRLGLLLREINGPWSSGSWSSDGNQFSVTLNEDAIFFTEVRAFADVRRIAERLNTDKLRIAERMSGTWSGAVQSIKRVGTRTGWEKVDRQLTEMQLTLNPARTEEQYQTVGLLCREVLISVAESAHDMTRHPVEDVESVSPTDAKRRLEAFFHVELRGTVDEEARSHAKAAVRLAAALQHKRTAGYRTAALCAEATFSVAILASIVANSSRPWLH